MATANYSYRYIRNININKFIASHGKYIITAYVYATIFSFFRFKFPQIYIVYNTILFIAIGKF